MASKSAETRRFGEKREAIVHAASELINDAGVQATTLSEVARAIGLNATSITYYFARKDQLVVAVYAETLDLMERIAADALAMPDPASRLRAFLDAHIALRDRIRQGERGLATTLSEIRTLEPDTQVPLMAQYLRVVDLVRRFFGDPADPARRPLYSARAHVLLEAVMWWPAWSLRYSTRDFGRIADRWFDIMAHGIPSRRGAWEPLALAAGGWRSDEDGAPSQNDEFLRAATALVNERGYRGASVNRIAETLNVTKGSFYHHHEAKDDLVLACFQNSYDRMSAAQMAGLALDADHWTQLASVLAELLDVQFFGAVPLLRTTALQALARDQKDDVVTRSNRLARRFAGMLIDGIADGSVRPIDPLIASQLIMSTLNGAYEARRWAERFGDPPLAIETYASTLSAGLLDPA